MCWDHLISCNNSVVKKTMVGEEGGGADPPPLPCFKVGLRLIYNISG